MSSPLTRISHRLAVLLVGLMTLGVSSDTLLAEATPSVPTPGAPDHLHNRVVYVPYGQLDRIFGKDRKGILVKYDQYQKLWQLAESRKPEPKQPGAPIKVSIEKAAYRGIVTEGRARFEATFQIRSLGEGPVPCPFGLRGAGLSSVTVDGEGGSLFSDAKGRLNLLLEGAGEKTVSAAFSTEVVTDESRRSARFSIPYACAGAMDLELPAQARLEDASVPVTAWESDAGKTRVQLAVGGNTDLFLAWTVQKEESSDRPLLLAESSFRLTVRPDALRLDADSRVSILRTEVSSLSLSLPRSYDLVAYDVPDLQHLETVEQEGRKLVRLDFHEPQKGVLRLKLSAEAGWAGSGPVSFPSSRIEGALRHRGKALVCVHQSLQARAGELEGARQIDLDSETASSAATRQLRPWRLFDFWQEDYKIPFDATPLPTETAAEVQTQFLVGEGQWSFSSGIRYHVRKGQQLKLRFRLPADWIIHRVTSKGREADWYEVTEDGVRAVEVEFPRKVASGGSFSCEVSCRLTPDDWLSEDWQSREVPVPLIWVEDATEQTGSVDLSATPQFEVSDRGLWGLKPKETRSKDTGRSSGTRLGYTYRRPYGGSVTVTRRSPRISAEVIHYVSVERDVYRINALVGYSIQYAATDELWVALPKGTGREVEIRGEDLKEKVLSVSEEEGADVWRIGLHRKRIGQYPLRISYERKIPSGRSAVEIGSIRALRIGRVIGRIGVEASSDIELHPQTQNLIEIDVTDIPKLPLYRPASRLIYAYKWLTHPFGLKLDIVRHEEERVLATVVSDARYRTVVDSGGASRTQANLTIRNASKPRLKLGLPERSQIWSVLVNGVPVKPSLAGDLLSVPLVVAEKEEAECKIVLTYETVLEQLGTIGGLALSGVRVKGVPVIASEWELFLPDRYEYLSRGGNMEAATKMKPTTQFARARDPEPAWPFFGFLDPRGRMDCQPDLRQLGTGMVQYAGQTGTRAFFRWPFSASSEQLAGSSGGGPPRAEAPGHGSQPADDTDFVAGGDVFGDIEKAEKERVVAAPTLTAFNGQGVTINAPPATDGEIPEDEQSDVKAVDGLPEVGGTEDLVQLTDSRRPPEGPGADGPSAGSQVTERLPFLRHGDPEQRDEARERIKYQTERRKLRQPRLLSMNVVLEGSGMHQSFKRLGGDPEIRISFVSRSFARCAAALLALVGLVFSALVCRREKVHPLFLLLVSGALLIGGPEAVAQWSKSFCLAAFYGIAIGTGLWLLPALARFRIPRRANRSGAPDPLRYSTISNLLLLPLFASSVTCLPDTQGEGAERSQPWKPGRTIYVPYNAEKPELPKTIDKVYLPYHDFLGLWQAAYPDREAPARKVAAPYTIGNATYRGHVDGKLAVFDASYQIEVLADEWTEVPLPLSGLALREATLDGQPAALSSGEKGYSLSFARAGRHVLNLSFTVPVSGASGSGGLSIGIPAVSATSLVFELPSHDQVGSVSPCRGGQGNVQKDGKTILEADLGLASQMSLSWSPRTALSANGLAAHVEATNQLSLIFQEAYLEASARMVFNVARKPAREVTVRVPKPLAVYSVSGDKLKGWQMDPADPELLRARFAEPIHGRAELEIRAGAPLGLSPEASALPLIAAANVSAESGSVTLFRSPNLKLEVTSVEGLRRGKSSPTPAPETGEGVRASASYVYSRAPVGISAKVQMLRPVVTASVHSRFLIGADEVVVRSALELDVKGSDLFGFVMEAPKSWEIEEIEGDIVQEWWTSDAEGLQRVHVTFKEPVQGHRTLTLKGLLPVSDPSKISLTSPRVVGAEVQRGSLFLIAGSSFSLTTRSLRALRPRDVRVFSENDPAPAGFVPAMAYSYREPAHSLEVSRTEVTPHVNMTAVTRATIETGVLKARIALRYEIRNAAVDAFSFSLPGYVGNQIEMKSSNIRQVKSERMGEGGDDRRIWNLKLHTPQLGTVTHQFDVELGISEDGDLRIPSVRALGVDRARYYLVLENRSEYVVSPKTLRSLQEVPLAELPFRPAGGEATTAATVYKARGEDYALELAKEMTKMQQLVEASIDWAEIKSSVTRDSRILTKAVYHMQNRTEQYLEVGMPEDAEVWSVFVRDEPVRPAVIQREGRTNLLIPLIKTTAGDLAFDAEVVYSQPMPEAFGTSGRQELTGPRIIGVPVTHTHWTLYLPRGFKHYWFDGNMDEIVEEVKMIDKLAALVKEQTQLLRSIKYGKGQTKWRAWSNLKQQRAKVDVALSEAKRRVSRQQELMAQKKLGRYQKGKFEGQIGRNIMNLQQLEQEVSHNVVAAGDLDESEAHAGVTQRPGPQGPGLDRGVAADLKPAEPAAPMPEEVEKVGALSIRVEIPKEGTPYHFKKLQGGAKVSFRYVSEDATDGTARGAAVVLVLVLLFAVRNVVRRLGARNA